MSRIAYRPEIDGLRALAVLPVVFFHSQLRVPGGFVGVDIFFVISGYLITALIAQDIDAGTFSLRDFWARRIRRIMPAATVTVAVSLLLGFFLMLPSDFEQLGRSAVAQGLLVANVFFYQTTGYFDAPAETKPLLHFWSLAVEEQFYLFFPFVLLLLRRWNRRAVVRVVAVGAAISFGISAVGAFYAAEATFYLLPTRAWELALGALLALCRGELPMGRSLRAPLGWLGLLLMIVPMIAYDAETPFPGVAALPPVLGAVLVIWATGEPGSLLQRMLALRPLVFIGLISYSLYLWHWPVKVFSHYWFTGLYSPVEMRVLVVVVSLGLAWLTWRYVETPFRSRRARVSARELIAGALAASAATMMAGLMIDARQGLPRRFPSEVVGYAAAYQDRPKLEEADLTIEDAEAGNLHRLGSVEGPGPSILLWGDSHARVVSPAVEAMCRELTVKGHRASRSETASLLNWGEPEIRRHNSAVFDWVKQHRPTVVVLASRWEKVLRSEADEAALRETVRTILDLGVSVSIMRQVASQQRDIPKALAAAELTGGDVEAVGILVEQHELATHRSNAIIDRVYASVSGLLVLDPIPYLAEEGRCIAVENGRPLYYDYQHLTTYGATRLTPMFEDLIETVARERLQGSALPLLSVACERLARN